MRNIIIVIAGVFLIVSVYSITQYWNDGVRKVNCNILIGGWHPDVPQRTRDICIERFKELKQEREQAK